MTSGNKELKTDDRLKETEQILDEYDKKFLVNKFGVNDEVENILGFKQELLAVLSRDDCFHYSLLLAQFALALQKEVNRQHAKLAWAKHNLDVVIGKEQSNYGDKYTKYELKKVMVINDNEYAKALNKIILDATMKIEEFNFLSARVNNMSEILKEYGKSKRLENATSN